MQENQCANYRGRFAPSSSGPLHLGSVVAALASWLDARAHGGIWLVRIEDIDIQRCKPEYAALIAQQLAALGLHADQPVALQSQRAALHRVALQGLRVRDLVYGCSCSRAAIAAHNPAIGASGEAVYPGLCRVQMQPGTLRNWRLRVAQAQDTHIAWQDRWLGAQAQDLKTECGDFVVAHANDYPAYHLACVVDDADAGITHIVRGADLSALTPRQIFLQRALGVPTPSYLHVPVMTDAQGNKLSKQNGAPAVDTTQPLATLAAAAAHLGLDVHHAQTPAELFAQAVTQWKARWMVKI
jgi:glutamyl-Q tRNA(Asp) synthetase